MSSSRTSTYLFEEKAHAALQDFLDRKTLFAFDLDGTLAPIVADPAAVIIDDDVHDSMAAIGRQALVAIITGRSRADALRYLIAQPHFLIGNHGAEGLPGSASRSREFMRITSVWQVQLTGLLAPLEKTGLIIENKGVSLSIHYRHAANIPKTHELILLAISRLTPQPRRIGGIYIENLLPPDGPDKGIALSELMLHTGCPKAFFAGDDETDEDIFRLDSDNIFTVRVGLKMGSRARYHLQSQHEIGRLLHTISGILERKQNSEVRIQEAED